MLRRFTALVVALVSTLSLAPSSASAIIGGNIREGDTSPYVSLNIGSGTIGQSDYNSSTPFCSGTLIGEKWVLSAAHCFKNHESMLPHYVVTVTNEAGVRTPYRVARIIIHPLYSIKMGHDVALVETQVPVVGAAYLPYGGFSLDVLKSLDTFATGWGMSVENTNSSVGLAANAVLSAQTPVTGSTAGVILTNFGKGKGSVCFGDSGGSLTAVDSRFTKPVLIGVIYAYNPDVAELCNIQNSFASVSVGHIASWIYDVSSIPPVVTADVTRDIIKDFGQGKVVRKVWADQSKTICSSRWVESRETKFTTLLAKATAENLVPQHPNYLPPVYSPDALIPVVLGGEFSYSNLAWFSTNPGDSSAKQDRVAFASSLNKQVCSGKMKFNKALVLYREYLVK